MGREESPAHCINGHVGYSYQHIWLHLEKETQSPAWIFELLENSQAVSGAVMEQGQVTMAGSLLGGTLGIPLPAASITPASKPGPIYISW